jgi:hypothetical protein
VKRSHGREVLEQMMGELSDRKDEDQIKEQLDVGHARMAVCFARAKQA